MLRLPEEAQRDAYKPRAQRFAIQAPLRCRAGGDIVLTEGTTLNISRSGVLFRAEKEIKPTTMLEMRITFPGELTGNGPASILCWGRVVRIIASSPGSVLAAAIIKYRFIKDD